MNVFVKKQNGCFEEIKKGFRITIYKNILTYFIPNKNALKLTTYINYEKPYAFIEKDEYVFFIITSYHTYYNNKQCI